MGSLGVFEIFTMDGWLQFQIRFSHWHGQYPKFLKGHQSIRSESLHHFLTDQTELVSIKCCFWIWSIILLKLITFHLENPKQRYDASYLIDAQAVHQKWSVLKVHHSSKATYKPSVISHSSSICHLESIICHLSSVIWNLLTIYLFSAHLCSILSELDSEDLNFFYLLWSKQFKYCVTGGPPNYGSINSL